MTTLCLYLTIVTYTAATDMTNVGVGDHVRRGGSQYARDSTFLRCTRSKEISNFSLILTRFPFPSIHSPSHLTTHPPAIHTMPRVFLLASPWMLDTGRLHHHRRREERRHVVSSLLSYGRNNYGRNHFAWCRCYLAASWPRAIHPHHQRKWGRGAGREGVPKSLNL